MGSVEVFVVLAIIMIFFGLHSVGFHVNSEKESVTVGFICTGDESTPYSANFLRQPAKAIRGSTPFITFRLART